MYAILKTIKHIIAAVAIVASLTLPRADAGACCTVCFGQIRTECYEFEGSCSNICCECPCVNSMSSHNNPGTDYILAIKGQPAYIVNGSIRIKIASDNMASFMSAIDTKYHTAKRDDPKIKKEISEAWGAFFKKPDNGSVSGKRLAAISSETGLKIYSSESGKR